MVDPTTVGMVMFASMLVLMALRVPIAAAMFIPGFVGYAYLSGNANVLNFMKGSAVARLTVYDLSVIPLFLLMGNFATQGGLSRDLFRAAAAFIGHIRGGLAMASIMSAGAFGAICGSSVATTATITQVAYPEMKRHGYHGRLSTGTLAAGGTLGILIPPSVPLVVYGILTEQSIAKLFAAALVPGVLALVGYLVTIALMTRMWPDSVTTSQPQDWASRVHHLLRIWPIVLIFLLVFGGIYGGLFSPTEGAAVGALLTFVMGLVRRELGWPQIRIALTAAAETSAMVFLIFLGADMFNAALALTDLPAYFAKWVTSLAIPPMAIVLSIMLMYVVLGCVMDEMSMLLLTIPVIFPAVMALDLWGLAPSMKAIWFGILVLMTVGIGMLAPPVGLNVYVVSGLTKEVPIAQIYKGIMPFLAWDVIRLLMLAFMPSMTLWLVTLMK